MKALWVMALAIIVGIGMNIDVAQAKRMGGGGSFGSKPSQSQPMQRDQATPDKAQTPPQGNNMQPANGGANPAVAARPGGAMGGMLGGLLMGGLLGAMFFGGAFENINFADIAIIALLAFVAFKLFKMFAARRAPQAATASAGNAPQHDMPIMTRDNINSSPDTGTQAASAASSPNFAAQNVSRRVTKLPAGFDESGFLAEAKNKYTELQAAWDSGDLGTLRQFTSDKVFGEVQDQYRARSGENRTELQNVNATLINITDDDSSTIASVLFEVAMIEHDANSPVMPQELNISEVWHFVRSKRAMRPEWILDGIQHI